MFNPESLLRAKKQQSINSTDSEYNEDMAKSESTHPNLHFLRNKTKKIIIIFGIALLLIALALLYLLYGQQYVKLTVTNKPVIGNFFRYRHYDAIYQERSKSYLVFKHGRRHKIRENLYQVQDELQKESKYPKLFIAPGTYKELEGPVGIYHIVVYSNLSKKQAMNNVEQLTKKQQGVYLIVPKNGERYYRVTIGHSKTQHEAEQKLSQLKRFYPDAFVLCY